MKVNDYEMITDEKNTLRLGESPYEPGVTHYLNTVLQSGDVFVDVGATFGYYTLLASIRVGWKGHVYAFEPYPEHFAILEENVKLNKRKRNVTLVQAAVMDFSASDQFLYLSQDNVADHRTAYSREDREVIPVQYMSLDDYLDPEARIDFIKLDIQGSEPYALLGMTEVLNRNPQVVIVTEFWPEGIRQAGWVPEYYLETLQKSGFILHTMDGEPRDPAWIMENIPGGWVGFTNLICTRT